MMVLLRLIHDFSLFKIGNMRCITLFSLSSPLVVYSSRLESMLVQAMLPLLRAPGKTKVVVLGRLPRLPHLFQIVDTELKNKAKQKGNQWPPQPAVCWSVWLVFLSSRACPGTAMWLRNSTLLSLWTNATLYLHCHYCWLLWLLCWIQPENCVQLFPFSYYQMLFGGVSSHLEREPPQVLRVRNFSVFLAKLWQ